MNRLLRAIGLSEYTHVVDNEKLLTDIAPYSVRREYIQIDATHTLVQITYSFHKMFGITLVGECDAQDRFHMEYCLPYGYNRIFCSEPSLVVEPKDDSDTLCGVCDNDNVGIPIIFTVQNVAECFRYQWSNQPLQSLSHCAYVGFSTRGTILLGVKEPKRNEEELYLESQVIAYRKNGCIHNKEDKEFFGNIIAYNYLETQQVRERFLNQEDILSIIRTSMMPYGAVSTDYTILGIIKDVRPLENPLTKEQIIRLQLNVNSIPMSVLINQRDLIGVPEVGRRFHGTISLQGQVMA